MNMKRKFAFQIARYLVLASSLFYINLAQAAPCPPDLFGALPSNCGVEPSFAAADYGPTQIENGQCPAIPTSFPAIHLVGSEAEFSKAYEGVKPGEAIVIKDGTYTWNTDYTLSKSGTSQNPIYIIYQTLHGAVFSNNNTEFNITGSNHVVAGFRFNNPLDEAFRIIGPDNRVACHYMQTGGANGYVYIGSSGADRTEIDNNVFENSSGIAVNLVRCNPQSSYCTNNPIGTHIHHNTWKNKPYMNANGHEAIKLGSGYHEAPGATTYSVDGNNTDAIVENNLFENWNGEAELISVKGDRNIIRNNCIKGSTNSNIIIRTGSNNLITGNWSDTAKEGPRISGRNNYYVFNYRRAASGGQMFRLHPGVIDPTSNLFKYTDATGNVLRFNVSSRMSRMVETEPRVSGEFYANPTGNQISDNVFYSDSLVGSNTSGSYQNGDGLFSESQFRSSNSWGANTVFGNDLPASECGNAELFDGPGGPGAQIEGSPDLLGAPGNISAPAWW
jgi:hypothetical protein